MSSDEAQEPKARYIPFVDNDGQEPPSMTFPTSEISTMSQKSRQEFSSDFEQLPANTRSRAPSPAPVDSPPAVEQSRPTFQHNSAQVLRVNIWKVPAAKIIKDVMKCQACNCIAVPPVYQCDNGHLLCAYCVKEVKKRKEKSWSAIPPQQSSQSWYFNAYKDILYCPVPVAPIEPEEEETNNETPCGEEIFVVTLGIYSKLYEASILNCPAEEFGCFEKIPTFELSQHLQECYYNKGKICPFTDCKILVRLTKFVGHLIINHGLEVLKDKTSYNIKVPQEKLQHVMPPPPINYFDRVGALIYYADCNYMLVLREHEEFILIWLHQIRPEPRTSIDDDEDGTENPAAEEDFEGKLDKASSVGNLNYTFKLTNQTGMEEIWAGTVRPYDETFGQVFESGNFYRIFMAKLKTKYMQQDENDPNLSYWNILVEFNDIEPVVDDEK